MSRTFNRTNYKLPAGCTVSIGPTTQVATAIAFQITAAKPVYLPPVAVPVRSVAEIAQATRQAMNAEMRAIKKAKQAAAVARKEAAAAKAAAKAAKPIRLRKDGKPYGSPKD